MAGYSARQSSFTTGDTILAAHSNDEFNQVLAAFNATTGHSHDGTAGEGGPITTLRDADSLNKILVDTSNNHLEFYVEVSSAAVQQLRIQDGAIVPITDNDIDLGTSSLEFKDLYVDGTAYVDAINFNGTAIASTAAELNILDGDTSATSTTVADADRVVLNDGGSMVQVAVTDLAAYFDDEITAMPNLTSVGTLTTLTVDDITINGSTVSDSGDFTIDGGADIILDADGGDIFFKDGGTTFGSATNTSGNLIIKSGTTTALTFSGADVTIAGDLTVSGDDITMGTNTDTAIMVADGTNFNPVVPSGDVTLTNAGVFGIASGVIVNADINASAAIADSKLATISTADKVSGAAVQIDGATDGTSITIADSDKFLIDDGGTTKYVNASQINAYTSAAVALDDISTGDAAATLATSAGDITIDAQGSDTDIILKGTDGGADTTFLTIDGSAAGAASFNSDVTVGALFKMPDVTSAKILVADGTSYQEVAVSGDVSIASSGAVTIGASAVENSMLAGSIEDSKLNTITTAGKVDIGALEIDGATDIGADLADADLLIVDDGANGTERKTAMSRVQTYIEGKISGDITISSGTAAIGSGVIVNADINSSAAIADSKLDTISTANKVSLTALDIDGGTDIGEAIVDADLFIVDNGAGGTNRKVAASRLVTYVDANSSAASVGKAIAMAIVFG